MSTAQELRLVLVTPEKTLRDEPVKALRLPLFDGSMGVLPGRAPLVGRLGAGELRITTGSGDVRYFIDGGFIQVKGTVVTVLTDRAIPVDNLKVAEAEAALEAAIALRPTTDIGFIEKDRAQLRARRMLALAQSKS